MWTTPPRHRAVIVWLPLSGPVELSTATFSGGRDRMSTAEIVSAATEVVLPPLPVLDAPVPRSVLVLVLPAVMLAGTVGFLVIGGGGTTSLLMGGLMAVSLVGMMIAGGGRQTKPAAQVAAERDRFLRQLDRARTAVGVHEDAARVAAHRRHPAPGTSPPVAPPTSQMSQRFSVRVGVGTVPAVVGCAPEPDDSDSDPEPFAAIARRWFVAAHANTRGMPLTVELRPDRPLILDGDAATDLARSVVLRWAEHASPTRSRIVLMADAGTGGWEWLDRLPHHRGSGVVDLLRTDDVLVARSWIGGQGSPAGTVVLLMTVAQPRAVREALSVRAGATVAVHVQPADIAVGNDDLVLCATGGTLRHHRDGRLVHWGAADALGPAAATATARSIATRHTVPRSAHRSDDGGPATDLAALLGVGRPRNYRPELHQTDPADADRLRVPIGVDDDGRPVHLDLKEAAQGGVGPHGLLIGATGSGKSELLRTLVLGLAATHRPSSLNLVLIDFKGGAGFLALADLPHVAAVITNLADQAALVARMRDALTGELNRRQELLRRAGNLSSAIAYGQARRRSPELPELPALVIVCDEFTELLVQHPELAETFVGLGRLGRSLGVHLLMASQRMEEGRMRGLDAHLSYRIALKTFSAADSRAVLDSDAAYRLPSTPGVGYFRTDAEDPRRFTAAYVSAVVPPDAPPAPAGAPDRTDREIHLLTAVPVNRRSVSAVVRVDFAAVADDLGVGSVESEEGPTLVDLWVDRLREHGPAAHRIWLPPLEVAPAVDELMERPEAIAGGGRLRFPVGLVDRPYEQRHDLLWSDLNGSTGHALVVGGPRAGKSGLVATMLRALTLCHPPAEMHLYVADLGGGSLASLAALPHTGAVVRRDEPERMRRMVAQLTGELAAREAGRTPPPASPDIVLAIDGWASFRMAFEELEQPVTALVQRGLAYGIHVVLTAARWADVRPALKDLMGLRFELRLGDPSESEVDRRRAVEVPERTPGRGLTTDGLHFLAATAGRRDADASTGTVGDPARERPGPGAPPVRLLPTAITVAELPALPTGSPLVPLGLGESALATVGIDLREDPHLVVWGDTASGRTTFLRTLATTVAQRWAPTEARFLVVDHRRTLLGRLPEQHLAGHATSAAATAALVADAVQVLTARLPAGDVTAAQLHRRGWWTGADLFVLVDDYDMVAAGPVNPLVPLLPLVPHARDIGLHLVVCRRASGGGRALYDPVLQLLRELGSPGLVMSGPADEGPCTGRSGPRRSRPAAATSSPGPPASSSSSPSLEGVPGGMGDRQRPVRPAPARPALRMVGCPHGRHSAWSALRMAGTPHHPFSARLLHPHHQHGAPPAPGSPVPDHRRGNQHGNVQHQRGGHAAGRQRHGGGEDHHRPPDHRDRHHRRGHAQELEGQRRQHPPHPDDRLRPARPGAAEGDRDLRADAREQARVYGIEDDNAGAALLGAGGALRM